MCAAGFWLGAAGGPNARGQALWGKGAPPGHLRCWVAFRRRRRQAAVLLPRSKPWPNLAKVYTGGGRRGIMPPPLPPHPIASKPHPDTSQAISRPAPRPRASSWHFVLQGAANLEGEGCDAYSLNPRRVVVATAREEDPHPIANRPPSRACSRTPGWRCATPRPAPSTTSDASSNPGCWCPSAFRVCSEFS